MNRLMVLLDTNGTRACAGSICFKSRFSSASRRRRNPQRCRGFRSPADFRDSIPDFIRSVTGKEPVERIPQTLSAELARHFTLGWSHYVPLLSIDDADARRFYEIEVAGGDWSVRELERQIDSSLYERLALSRGKREVRRLDQWPRRFA